MVEIDIKNGLIYVKRPFNCKKLKKLKQKVEK